MKNVARIFVVIVMFWAFSALAAGIDGTYTFSSRVKEGKPDLVGWKGSMVISSNMMSRSYTAPDGKEEKFYEGTMKKDGDTYVVKFTKAYKPEYVGNEHKNKITVSQNTLTMESVDGKFKETWTKK